MAEKPLYTALAFNWDIFYAGLPVGSGDDLVERAYLPLIDILESHEGISADHFIMGMPQIGSERTGQTWCGEYADCGMKVERILENMRKATL